MNYFACYEAIRMPHEAHFIGYGRGPKCVRSELRLDGRDAVRRRRHLLGLKSELKKRIESPQNFERIVLDYIEDDVCK